MSTAKPLISLVIPCYNEADSVGPLFKQLKAVLQDDQAHHYELLFVNDGSQDDTFEKLQELAKSTTVIRVISLTRNFGKEIATTAGITQAKGEAIITLDADAQFPPEFVPEFIERWQQGSKVVIGVRTANQNEGVVKRYGSKLFYGVFRRMTGMKLTPGATDFRLIDRSVQQEFIRMTERNRITRGLIEWMGYDPTYIQFKANPRLSGEAGYSFAKLLKLAINSMVSLSLSPLYITAYIGAVVLPLSVLLGLVMLVNFVFGDPLTLHATGTAYVMVLVLFLIGVLLVSQGIIGLYLSHIHSETQNRPLFIIDKDKSIGE